MTADTALQTITLVHPTCLFEAPAFDARPLAILGGGGYARAGAPARGFLPLALESGLRGYVPAALCAPHAAQTDGGLPTIGVVQDVALYRSPEPGDQFSARWIVAKDELLRVLGREGRFVRVQRADGQVGYLPQALCRESTAAHGAPPIVRAVQPVSLYSDPAPGSQLDSRWIVSPGEPLLLLGHDGRFALVQRQDGRLGYVPSALCGQPVADAIVAVGPVDLGWIALGGGWGMANWGGVAAALSQPPFDAALRPFLGLGLVLGAAALLWLGSRRRLAARSFAVGLLLAYALLHLLGGGVATLWR
jgi:hypothetical protein